jgi:hypothetical protein
MNESPSPLRSRRTRQLIVVWTSIGLLLALALGVEFFFLLRSWKRGTLIEANGSTRSNSVSIVDGNTTEGEVIPANPASPRPRKPARIPNDNFADRFNLDTPAHETAMNAGASNERGERIQNTQVGLVRWGDTLWWKWIAPTSGPVVIDTIGSDFDTYLAVYIGAAVNALTVITENDNATEVGVGESLVTFNAQQGTEYQIQVGGVFTGGGRGSIPVTGTLELSLVMPPSVTIESPVSGSLFPVGSNIGVNVNATSLAGRITNFSLYRGVTPLGRASQSPHHFTVGNAPAGTNSVYAVATDSIGQLGTSAVVRILVANAGITITSPADGAVMQSMNPITVAAFPMLRTGSITNVSFFVDGRAVAQATNAPFRAMWSSVASGSHHLTARAWDDSGNTYNATPVNIAVANTFFPTGSVWKYLDDGSDQGTKWYAPDFDDTSWKSGPAELGYGDRDEATRVEDNDNPGFNRADTEHYITTYFRRAFFVTNIANFSHLLMNMKRDDGAVVYLNGRESGRFNMNTGAVNYLTLARNAGDDGKAFISATVHASFLVEGTNVVAVEIHQATVDSTDISFEMDLSGIPIHRTH